MEAEGQDLLAIDNEVTLSVTYINEYGKEVPTTVTKTFNSEANVTVTGTLSIADVEGEIENGNIKNNNTYQLSDFVVDSADYTPYGNITLETESVEFGGTTYTSGDITLISTASGTLKVNIKPFLNSSGEEVKNLVITLDVVKSL